VKTVAARETAATAAAATTAAAMAVAATTAVVMVAVVGAVAGNKHPGIRVRGAVLGSETGAGLEQDC